MGEGSMIHGEWAQKYSILQRPQSLPVAANKNTLLVKFEFGIKLNITLPSHS